MHGYIGHMITSALIHGAVYGVIFHLFRSMHLGGTVMVAGAIIAGTWLITRIL